MNRANQHALFQQTNIGLLGIRQAELNYYINMNIAFGTQAALIGGFTYSVFTQNQYDETTDYGWLFQDIYWVVSAGSIAASVHVIVTTTLLQVLGPGLALHGPIGSVARACSGMRQEQKAIFTSFFIMLISFSLATVLSFWAVMTFESAVGGTAVFAIAARYWYFYCERIYLRFYWKTEDEYNFQEEADDENPAEQGDEPPIPGNPLNPKASRNPMHDMNAADRVKRNSGYHHQHTPSVDLLDPEHVLTFATHRQDKSAAAASNKTTNSTKQSTRRRFFPSFSFRKRQKSKEETSAKSIAAASTKTTESMRTSALIKSSTDATLMANAMMSASGNKVIIMEGYLIKKTVSKNLLLSIATLGTVDATQGNWERRYVILNCYGQLFYYKTRQDFRTDPKKPFYKRPVNLIDFYIRVINSLHTETIMESTKVASEVVTVSDRKSASGGNGGLVKSPSAGDLVQVQRRSSATNIIPVKTPDTTRFEIILIPRDYVKVKQQEQEETRTNYSGGSGRSIGGGSKEEGGGAVPQNWIFRCDTEEELIIWTNCMKEMCPSAFYDFTTEE